MKMTTKVTYLGRQILQHFCMFSLALSVMLNTRVHIRNTRAHLLAVIDSVLQRARGGAT